MNSIINEDIRIISEDSIINLENSLSFDLPNDYRQFLIENNGGMPNNDCFDFVDLLGNNNSSDVLCFFSVEKICDHIETILENMEMYQNRILDCFIPIGEDSGGNIILLRKCDNNIYFWDHNLETSPPSMDNCFYLSQSFLDFFNNKLYSYSE